jgi:hypothetical protein
MKASENIWNMDGFFGEIIHGIRSAPLTHISAAHRISVYRIKPLPSSRRMHAAIARL